MVSGQYLQYIFFHVNDALSTKHLYPFLDALKLFQRLVSPNLWKIHCKNHLQTAVSLQFSAHFL